MKFIVILRNPIERAFSQWNMQRSRGNEPFDFVEAVQAEPRRIADLRPNSYENFLISIVVATPNNWSAPFACFGVSNF